MNKKLLKKQIENYLLIESGKQINSRKKAIIKTLTKIAETSGIVEARSQAWEILSSIEQRSALLWLKDYLDIKFHSFYREKYRSSKLTGWWNPEEQVLAEELPIVFHENAQMVFFNKNSDKAIWEKRGFYKAIAIPVLPIKNGVVDFPTEKTAQQAKLGFAKAQSIQWYWDKEEGLVVTRNVLDCGFWKAWKWWGESTQWWYLERHPEYFSDFGWWNREAPKPAEPPNDPYAVVLGGRSQSGKTTSRA